MIATQTVNGHSYQFDSLVEVLAKATPRRSGDELAGCAAGKLIAGSSRGRLGEHFYQRVELVAVPVDRLGRDHGAPFWANGAARSRLSPGLALGC